MQSVIVHQDSEDDDRSGQVGKRFNQMGTAEQICDLMTANWWQVIITQQNISSYKYSTPAVSKFQHILQTDHQKSLSKMFSLGCFLPLCLCGTVACIAGMFLQHTLQKQKNGENSQGRRGPPGQGQGVYQAQNGAYSEASQYNGPQYNQMPYGAGRQF